MSFTGGCDSAEKLSSSVKPRALQVAVAVLLLPHRGLGGSRAIGVDDSPCAIKAVATVENENWSTPQVAGKHGGSNNTHIMPSQIHFMPSRRLCAPRQI
ncbi:hypothetical protein M427DRAFT_50406 [Gonapodya prolifera JEL478]|uniref:Uncharacterized protein n=1 Tax=Gonapodya prolifera (strain JEL478) TaxID=1344416 RepID=A0A139AZ58_GONPJ|nr:hypothetical protein M427DRAFT_50406 [Gonapodya prolifera JEL478]|eukprot:KXS22042.1 hypothetical protein M427DRAFT_50406 [Gonapodya prolifera JEL478]